jgi:hypothetical protein
MESVALHRPKIGTLAYNLISSKNDTAVCWRANLNSMWPEFHDLADENFVSHFCIDPHARAWEMQLGVALRRKGMNPSAPKPGPDFLVLDGQQKIWIEAVVFNSGSETNHDRIAPFDMNRAQYVPHDAYSLRISSVVDRKRKKFVEYRAAGFVGQNDRCVIAVCCAIGGGHIAGSMDAIRAVYPLGPQTITINRETAEVVRRGYAYQGSLERQEAGKKPIPKTAFLDPLYAETSGILYWELPFVNTLQDIGEKYSLVHNYVATTKLPMGWWKSGREFWYEEVEQDFLIQSREL